MQPFAWSSFQIPRFPHCKSTKSANQRSPVYITEKKEKIHLCNTYTSPHICLFKNAEMYLLICQKSSELLNSCAPCLRCIDISSLIVSPGLPCRLQNITYEDDARGRWLAVKQPLMHLPRQRTCKLNILCFCSFV